MKTKLLARLTRRNFLKSSLALISSAALSVHTRISMGQNTQKRIYLAPDDHTDYFWTAGETIYRQAFLDMIDYYLDQADTTQNNPSDFQGRWNCDGSFWIWIYEKNRTPAQFDRLIHRIRDGHISFPLNALVVCLGGAPAEAVLRGMYYSGQLERRYNLRVRVAIAMENQTLPLGLMSLWYGSGARFSWRGICGCDTRVLDPGNRQHEIYWSAGLDGSRILMKWNSMLGNNQSIGGYAEARNSVEAVNYVDSDPSFIARYPYSVIGAFGKGWDDLQTLTSEFITTAQNMSNDNRRVIVSNQHDFFQDFETTYGGDLPSLACSFGNEWDLYCAALAEVSARVKRSVEKLRTAETVATLVSLKNSSFMNTRRSARDLAWIDLGLYWEHNFGMVSSPSGLVNERNVWQHKLAGEIEAYVDTLYNDALTGLGGMIQKSGTNTRFFVFNSLNWIRTGYADLPFSGTDPFKVIDVSTDNEVPSQIVLIDGQRKLRIFAENVPSIGYKVFEVRPGAGQSYPDAASVSGNQIENAFYRITLAERGAITSLLDKNRSYREFVQVMDGRAINDLGTGTGTLQVENQGPVSVTLLATSAGPLAHTTRVTLVRGSNVIQLHNEINQNFDSPHTWHFGLNLSPPDVWHEEVGAIIRAKLLGQGGHYSDRSINTRYDWMTLNHFVDMSNGQVGLSISNADCCFMKVGNSTESVLDSTTPKITVLAGGRVANGNNGLPNQGGDTHFMQRFAIQIHDAFDRVNAMKFAMEHQNPMVTGIVTGGSQYPAASFSLLTTSNPNIILWAIKLAEDGPEHGIILRLWNISTSPQALNLSLNGVQIFYAESLSHIETPLGAATFVGDELRETLAAQQLRTFALHNHRKLHIPILKR